jgi:hypothetical protein
MSFPSAVNSRVAFMSVSVSVADHLPTSGEDPLPQAERIIKLTSKIKASPGMYLILALLRRLT